MRISGLAPSSLVGNSIAVENTLASVFESTPVHGDLPPRCGAVKFLPPEVSKRFLIPSKSKKGVAASAAEHCMGAGFDDVGFGFERDLGVGDDFRPDSFGGAGFRAFCDKNADRLLSAFRL